MSGRANAGSIRPYLHIARIDHWFKNLLMLAGVAIAYFVEPEVVVPEIAGAQPLLAGDVFGLLPAVEAVAGASAATAAMLAIVFLATSLVASSNYTLNELLDAPFDRLHPTKHARPAAAGLVRPRLAILQWLALACAGLWLAYAVHPHIAMAAALLWGMGIVYNVEPLRAKDVPHIDVLTEAINNPIRLVIGWFALIPHHFPPLSLLVAYWMAGAFFMALKRFAEYRHIAESAVAASYRRSFAHYSPDRLLVSTFFYAMVAALFSGVFIVRYRLELILGIPLAAGFFAYYLHLGLKPDSPVQRPESLWRERSFVVYAGACAVAFVMLMSTSVPALYDLFRVELKTVPPLWTIGEPR